MISGLKIAALDFLYADSSAAQNREALAAEVAKRNLPAATGQKKLLVDVSVIINGDARTGIQRVVRAILSELLKNPPEGYAVRPVFATAEHGYHFAPNSFDLAGNSTNVIAMPSKPVSVANGDAFLGLDLAAAVLPKHQAQLQRWKLKGATIHIVVYDLLPVLHPEWFHSRTTRNFYRWLRAVAVLADSAVCISKSVKADFQKWLDVKYRIHKSKLPVHVIPMGCDLEASVPSMGMPDNSETLLAKFSAQPSLLMVGTLEPRKGHHEVIDAFEELWSAGNEINLVLVGKAGWKTSTLLERINKHKQNGIRLYWLDSISDQCLLQIYTSVNGVIVASMAEGFGLPIIEALKMHRPVLARSIPVFTEVKHRNLFFFKKNSSAKNLAEEILNLLNLEQPELAYSNESEDGYFDQSWQVTVRALISSIHINRLTKTSDLL